MQWLLLVIPIIPPANATNSLLHSFLPDHLFRACIYGPTDDLKPTLARHITNAALEVTYESRSTIDVDDLSLADESVVPSDRMIATLFRTAGDKDAQKCIVDVLLEKIKNRITQAQKDTRRRLTALNAEQFTLRHPMDSDADALNLLNKLYWASGGPEMLFATCEDVRIAYSPVSHITTF